MRGREVPAQHDEVPRTWCVTKECTKVRDARHKRTDRYHRTRPRTQVATIADFCVRVRGEQLGVQRVLAAGVRCGVTSGRRLVYRHGGWVTPAYRTA